MATELTTDTNPLDANLEKVLPGLCHWHKANQDTVERIKQDMIQINNNVVLTLEAVVEESRANRLASDQHLASALHHIASAYDGSTNLPTTNPSPSPTIDTGATGLLRHRAPI